MLTPHDGYLCQRTTRTEASVISSFLLTVAISEANLVTISDSQCTCITPNLTHFFLVAPVPVQGNASFQEIKERRAVSSFIHMPQTLLLFQIYLNPQHGILILHLETELWVCIQNGNGSFSFANTKTKLSYYSHIVNSRNNTLLRLFEIINSLHLCFYS